MTLLTTSTAFLRNRVLPALALVAWLMTTPVPAQAQSTQFICAGQSIPTDWVHVDTLTSSACGNVPNGTLQIQPTTGQTSIAICSDQQILPDNWLWTGSGTSFGRCRQAVGSMGTSPRYHNVRTITNVSRATQLWACTAEIPNVDWQASGYAENANTCLQTSVSPPSGYPHNMVLLQRRCVLGANPLQVGAGQTFVYSVQGTTIPAGSKGYWYGTKNGVVDATKVLFGTVPGNFSYVNEPGWEGQYTRWAEIRTPADVQACRTNVVDQTIAPMAPFCSLSVDRPVVPPYGNYTFTASVKGSLPAGSLAYWYGTRNGQPDAFGNVAGSVPASFPYTSQPSWAGTYTRYLVVRNGSNTVCQTNPVTTVLQ